MIKNVLFDLDGTLLDSPKIIMASFEKAVLEHAPEHELTANDITIVLGQTLVKAFTKYAKDEQQYQKMVKTFREVSVEKTEEMLNLYDNAEQVIKHLRNQGYKVGIVTSKSRRIVLENFQTVAISEALFDCIITAEDTINHKPNPEPLLKALEILGGTVNETIYIGDHENDIVAGKNANMATGLMRYTYRLEEGIKEKPTYIFDDLNHIKLVFK